MTAQSSLVSQLTTKLSPASQQFLASTAIGQSIQAAQPEPQPLLPLLPDIVPDADQEKMALFEAILDEAENLPATAPVIDTVPNEPAPPSLIASVPPQALPQLAEDLWQQAHAAQQSQGSAAVSKERAAGQSWTLDSAVQESGGMLSQVEAERAAEISPEVETYLQKVEDAQETPAEKIEALVPAVSTTPPAQQTQLVRVVPITPKVEATGKTKSTTFSVRWLVEFSHKIIKMFNGKVIYQQPIQSKT
jgi:hypothetical protein